MASEIKTSDFNGPKGTESTQNETRDEATLPSTSSQLEHPKVNGPRSLRGGFTSENQPSKRRGPAILPADLKGKVDAWLLKFGPRAFAAIERFLESGDPELVKVAIEATVRLISIRLPREVRADIALDVQIREQVRAILSPSTFAEIEAQRAAVDALDAGEWQ